MVSKDNSKVSDYEANITNRLVGIAKSINDRNFLAICKETLLYFSGDVQANSRINVHMPERSGKRSAQIKAMDIMLRENKIRNGCFVDEKTSYVLIINALIRYAGKIAKWLQSDSTENYYIALNESDVNDIVDISQRKYKAVGYVFEKDSSGHIEIFDSQAMTIVLRKNEYSNNNPLGFNGLCFHVHTAYPGIKLSDSDDQLFNIEPMIIENIVNIIKNTPYYMNASDINKILLLIQTSKKFNMPYPMSIDYDKQRDAIVICITCYIDRLNNKYIYAQERCFIKEVNSKTVISAALYTKEMNNTCAEWIYSRELNYPSFTTKSMADYISKMQNGIDKALRKIKAEHTP